MRVIATFSTESIIREGWINKEWVTSADYHILLEELERAQKELEEVKNITVGQIVKLLVEAKEVKKE
jgi:hypothetical protein